MAANRDVQNFFEVRAGLQGMLAFAEAALRFMDESGIAMQIRTKRVKEYINGNGNGHGTVKNVAQLGAQARALFVTKRRKAGGAKPEAAEPDGKHVTMKEAAKMLKMSEANVRLMCHDGRLPKPTQEYRPWSKAQPDRKKNVQVILKDDVVAYREREKAELQQQEHAGQ